MFRQQFQDLLGFVIFGIIWESLSGNLEGRSESVIIPGEYWDLLGNIANSWEYWEILGSIDSSWGILGFPGEY